MSIISKHDSRVTLDFLRYSTEWHYFERKWIDGTWIKPTKLANELIGMLNSDGWIIVLWISDTWVVQDLNTLPPPQLEQYRKVCFDFIKPSANIIIEEIILETWELIFIYHVDQDYERVFSRKDNEDVYLRISDSNKGPLNRDEARKLEYDKSIRRFEDEVCEDFDDTDLRESVLAFYAQKLNFSWNYDQLLLNRHLAVYKNWRILYKNAAILLFSEDPEKYIPSASVRYIRYSWVSQLTGASLNITKDEVFIWCIPRLIEIIKKFLIISLKDYYYLDISVGTFTKVSEYPEEAWLEWIVNALCHRSYNLQWNKIYIKHYDDRLEISNSWPLPAQVTIANIRDTRFSRNPRIARVLTEFWYVRELNEWTARIFESMEKSMLPQPEYLNENNIVTLVLRNNIANHDATISETTMARIEKIFEQLGPTERLIIGYLFENHQATISDLLNKIPKTEQAIRNGLNSLINLNILIKSSERQKLRDKNAVYSFKKS
jgi:ATP-dependent DNA helicase RecG